MTIKLVLDTNVVLDWLVFDDPFMNPLRDRMRGDGMRDKGVAVFTYQPAIDELKRVLGYKHLKLDMARQTKVLADYQANTSIVSMPTNFSLQQLLLPKGFPRCTDRDDEPFLALAFHIQADALVSRDKAVLQLSKRARNFGVNILDVQQLIAMLG